MKRLFIASALCLTLIVSKPALAADKNGVYVAPKFFVSQQNSDGFGESDNVGFGVGNPLRDATNIKKNKSDTNAGGGLAVGYDFRPTLSLPIRTEIEFASHGQATFSRSGNSAYAGGPAVTADRKASVSTLFANVFYDIDTGTKFTPYVGGGIGVAQIRVKDYFWHAYGGRTGSSSKTVNNFAWSLGTGVAYSFDNNWSADLGFRYNDFGKVKANAVGTNGYVFQAKDRVSSQEVLLGLRYGF